MPNIQKNLQLPKDVLDWFEEMERETGASHSRIALAAIASYTVTANKDLWMKIAVLMNKGDLSLEDVPAKHVELTIEHCEDMLRHFKEHPPESEPEIRHQEYVQKRLQQNRSVQEQMRLQQEQLQQLRKAGQK